MTKVSPSCTKKKLDRRSRSSPVGLFLLLLYEGQWQERAPDSIFHASTQLVNETSLLFFEEVRPSEP